MECERQRGVKDVSKVFGLSIWSIGVSKAVKYYIISTFISLKSANIPINVFHIILWKWRLGQNTKGV